MRPKSTGTNKPEPLAVSITEGQMTPGQWAKGRLALAKAGRRVGASTPTIQQVLDMIQPYGEGVYDSRPNINQEKRP